MNISVETAAGGKFLEAYYNFMGELNSANICFRKCFDQPGFIKRARPDDSLRDSYQGLVESGTDLMFEADMRLNTLNLYHYSGDSDGDDIEIISSLETDIPSRPVLIDFPSPDRDSAVMPVKFFASLEDNILTLGFCLNERLLVYNMVSALVNFGKLGGSATPGEVKRILNNVFLRT